MSWQTRWWGGVGLEQLCRHATQASFKLSVLSPGISDQLLKTHRLLLFNNTEGVGVWRVGVGMLMALGSAGALTLSVTPQEASNSVRPSAKAPTIDEQRSLIMGLILLEALLALALLMLIVWWTMFSGRQKGELKSETKDEPTQALEKERNKEL
jgi:hypothetical protein